MHAERSPEVSDINNTTAAGLFTKKRGLTCASSYQAEVFPDGSDEDEVRGQGFRFQLPLELGPKLPEGYVRQNSGGEEKGQGKLPYIHSVILEIAIELLLT